MSPDLFDTVRDTLDERARTLEVRTPTWTELQTGLGRARQARRRQRAVRAGSLLAAVGLAVGAGQTVLPSLNQPPAITAGARSVLDRDDVRGSLGSDDRFVAALRDVARKEPGVMPDYRLVSAADVHVLYASNVPGRTLALVQTLRSDGRDKAIFWDWYAGPSGARADQLRWVSGDVARGDRAMIWLASPARNDRGLLVVVSARQQAYLVAATAPVYAADGTVRREVTRVVPDPNGVIERELPTTPRTWIMATPDTTPRKWTEVNPNGFATGVSDKDVPRTTIEGRPVPPRALALLDGVFSDPTGTFGPAGSPRSVLWTGALGGWSAVAVAVTAPSGARIVGIEMQAPEPKESTGHVFLNRSVTTVLPKGRLSDAALAWQLISPADAGKDHPPVRQIGVLGPVGATSARLVDGQAQLAEVQLKDRAGVLPPPGAGHKQARVEFRNAAGQVVATVGVLASDAELPTGLPR